MYTEKTLKPQLNSSATSTSPPYIKAFVLYFQVSMDTGKAQNQWNYSLTTFHSHYHVKCFIGKISY